MPAPFYTAEERTTALSRRPVTDVIHSHSAAARAAPSITRPALAPTKPRGTPLPSATIAYTVGTERHVHQSRVSAVPFRNRLSLRPGAHHAPSPAGAGCRRSR